MSRLSRWLTVRAVAWAIRRELTMAVIDDALRKSHPHRDWAWREQVYQDANACLERKTRHG